MERSHFVTLVVGGLVASLVYVLLTTCNSPSNMLSLRTKDLIGSSISFTIGILLWPVVWYVLVGGHVIERVPITVLGLLWSFVMMSLDLLWTTRQPYEQEDVSRGRSSFSFDGNSISSLAFALGGLLVSQVGKDFAQSASPMLSACVFLVVAFVVPGPSVHSHSTLGSILIGSKKIAMAWCVGLLISAISISLHQGFKLRM